MFCLHSIHRENENRSLGAFLGDSVIRGCAGPRSKTPGSLQGGAERRRRESSSSAPQVRVTDVWSQERGRPGSMAFPEFPCTLSSDQERSTVGLCSFFLREGLGWSSCGPSTMALSPLQPCPPPTPPLSLWKRTCSNSLVLVTKSPPICGGMNG